jgi:hypothetical protein
MADFAIALGVPRADVLMELSSKTTYENLVEVKKIIGAGRTGAGPSSTTSAPHSPGWPIFSGRESVIQVNRCIHDNRQHMLIGESC